jgi:branched-subunit amino acid transport protein AzlD
MSNTYIIVAIIMSALITLITRSLPFVIFRSKRKVGPALSFIAKTLPVAVITILIVYSISHITFVSVDGWIKEVAGIIFVVALHLLKRNTLLSVLGGTLFYMLLIQLGV